MEVELENRFKTLNTDDDSDYSEIQLCVKNIIKNEGFIKYSVDKKVFPTDGSNFLGILCEINIKGLTDKGEKETNLFMKIITPGEQMTLLSLPDAYKKELFVYCELSNIFTELQDEVNLPQGERFKMVKCYKESTPKVIVLENMEKKGFVTHYRMDTMSIQFAKLAVKELAKFHALSFVLEARRPKYYDKKIKSINQPIVLNEDWKVFCQNMCQLTLNCLDGDKRRKFEDFIPTMPEKLMRYLSNKSGGKVLCHGDYRTNNILMKKVNGVISELVPIDYQLIYYGCPVIDFMYLIFPATDRNFRKAHLPYLKNLYHETLKSFLRHFDIDVANVYPRDEFERHYKERLDYGLMISVNLVPFLVTIENEMPDITRNDLAAINLNVDNTFKERITGLVDDFIDWGYL